MADYTVRCIESADPAQPVQPPCPEGYALVLSEQIDPVYVSGGELEPVVALGAAAILVPFLMGLAYRTVCDFLES
ncbi:MAG: hypothetical protein JKY97_00960 [Citromicrobium sp.]|nr:hypothetical protein [Citromicrobium sp.]